MEMLAPSHYESIFSSTALVYRRSHMCRFECNDRMCAEELLPQNSPLDIQVAHSVVWLSLVDSSGSQLFWSSLGSSRRLGSYTSAVYICVYWPN